MKKKRSIQTLMGNRASEEALGIQRQNEKPLDRGLGQVAGRAVQSLTVLFCAKTLMLG